MVVALVTCVVEAGLGVWAGGVEPPHPGRGQQLGGLALSQGLDAVLGAALRVARVAPPHQVPGTTRAANDYSAMFSQAIVGSFKNQEKSLVEGRGLLCDCEIIAD